MLCEVVQGCIHVNMHGGVRRCVHGRVLGGVRVNTPGCVRVNIRGSVTRRPLELLKCIQKTINACNRLVSMETRLRIAWRYQIH